MAPTSFVCVPCVVLFHTRFTAASTLCFFFLSSLVASECEDSKMCCGSLTSGEKLFYNEETNECEKSLHDSCGTSEVYNSESNTCEHVSGCKNGRLTQDHECKCEEGWATDTKLMPGFFCSVADCGDYGVVSSANTSDCLCQEPYEHWSPECGFCCKKREITTSVEESEVPTSEMSLLTWQVLGGVTATCFCCFCLCCFCCAAASETPAQRCSLECPPPYPMPHPMPYPGECSVTMPYPGKWSVTTPQPEPMWRWPHKARDPRPVFRGFRETLRSWAGPREVSEVPEIRSDPEDVSPERIRALAQIYKACKVPASDDTADRPKPTTGNVSERCHSPPQTSMASKASDHSDDPRTGMTRPVTSKASKASSGNDSQLRRSPPQTSNASKASDHSDDPRTGMTSLAWTPQPVTSKASKASSGNDSQLRRSPPQTSNASKASDHSDDPRTGMTSLAWTPQPVTPKPTPGNDSQRRPDFLHLLSDRRGLPVVGLR